MFLDKVYPHRWVYLLPLYLFSVLCKVAFGQDVPRTATVRTRKAEFLVRLGQERKAPWGLEVLEVLVRTTLNSTSQGSLWNSISSVTFLRLVLAPFSGCTLRWLLTYKKKLSILVQDWTEKAFYRNLVECVLPEGRLHRLHACISCSWGLTR